MRFALAQFDRDASRALLIEVQPNRIGASIDCGDGVFDVRDAADFDAEHGA